jgi:hypothetical protein
MMPSHILDDAINNVIVRVNEKVGRWYRKKSLVLSERFILHFWSGLASLPPWIMPAGL